MLAPGTLFGSYKIQEMIGKGGMGDVYCALDLRLDRQVALKLIHEDLSMSGRYRDLLASEARAAARIDSPHVVKIWEHGEIDGLLYISLELVMGVDLRSLVKSLTVEQKIGFAIQLAHGMQAAHQAGLIHRDLKPENIKVSPNNILKILDFGLAMQLSAQDSDLALRVQTETTRQSDKFVGTLCYASPEQLGGESLTSRSDIFSAGVILYEMFTGVRPFSGSTPASIVYAILNEEPVRPSLHNREISPWLEQLILKAMAKKPMERFQNAASLAELLGNPTKGGSLRGPGAPVVSRQTVTVIDLRNLSNEASWELFAQGFTEELIRELGRRTDVIVSAQPSNVNTRDIRDLFNTCRSDFAITGTLLTWNRQVRISLDIFRNRDLQLIFGKAFDFSSEDLFGTLTKIASEVAMRLADETGGSAHERSSPHRLDVNAYEYYLKGRAYYQTNRPEDLKFAESMYRRALEIDPEFALAHAGLSDLYTFQYMCYYDRSVERIESARDEALKALSVSASLPDGYRSLGRYHQALGDSISAESNLLKAIDCDPKYALAYRAMAWLKEGLGNYSEAMQWAKKALELSPLDTETLLLIGRLHMADRKYTASLSILQRAIDLKPDYGRAHYEMATVFLKIGALAQATEYFDSACRFGGDPNAYIQLGYVNFVRGNIEVARTQFQTAIRDGNLVFAANYLLGLLERSQGRVESARQYFSIAVEQAVASFREESPDANLLGYHALALAALGKSEESHSILKRINELGEMDGEILLLVARTLAVLGSRVEAESCVLRAMKAYAGPTEAELEFDPHFVGYRADERHFPLNE